GGAPVGEVLGEDGPALRSRRRRATGAGLALVAHAGVLLVGLGLGAEAGGALRPALAAVLAAGGPALGVGVRSRARPPPPARVGRRRGRVGPPGARGPAEALGALDADAAVGQRVDPDPADVLVPLPLLGGDPHRHHRAADL